MGVAAMSANEADGGQGSGRAVDPRGLRESASFPQGVIAEIQRAASEGLYEIRGFGAKRRLPTLR